MINLQVVLPNYGGCISDLRRLFTDYQAELGLDLGFQGFDQELASLPGSYAPPKGCALVAYSEGEAVACGALREIGPGVAELKRIYVARSHRGKGIGKAISIRLIEEAKARDYKVVRLDTLGRLQQALSLYIGLGFREIDPYNDSPDIGIRYFELSLSS